MFGGAGDLDNVPTITMSASDLGGKLLDVLTAGGVFASKSEGRRLISQGGLYANNEKVVDVDLAVTQELFADEAILIRKGKKNYYRLVIG